MPTRARPPATPCAMSSALAWSDRDESERPRGVRVAAAGDDHPAEPRERRLAAGPVGVREQRMARTARAVRAERPLVGGGCRPRRRPAGSASPRAACRRASGTDSASRGRTSACSEWTRTSVPPSRTGNASRHCRSARPSTTPADVIGLSDSRGTCAPTHGTPTTIASSGSSRRVPRSSTLERVPLRARLTACRRRRRP